MTPIEPSADEAAKIRRRFKRCDPETVAAIIRFRGCPATEMVPPIARGIVWRYLKEPYREALDAATAETPLAALGIESLAMLEIVLDLQEAFGVLIEDGELRRLETLGDIVALLKSKVADNR